MIFVFANYFPTNILEKLNGTHFEGRMQLSSSDGGSDGDSFFKVEKCEQFFAISFLEGGEQWRSKIATHKDYSLNRIEIEIERLKQILDLFQKL